MLKAIKEEDTLRLGLINVVPNVGYKLNLRNLDVTLGVVDYACGTTPATGAVAYAENPHKTSKIATPKRVAQLTPATLLLTDRILKDFGHSVVKSATQVRHLVTNKLIEETENPDPRIRIRALELLGKVSDGGLFAEKSEVTITHQTSDDLKDKLREKLSRLVNPEEIDDAIMVDGDIIDVDKELGLDV